MKIANPIPYTNPLCVFVAVSVQIGDPKCLDGDRADLVVCRPESGGSGRLLSVF